MSHQSDLIAEDIEEYLKQHEQKDLLRFITCGSVDDGKSTLIGRLLHDSKMIYEDQLAALSKDSKKSGTTGEEIDLALLVDGLQSEREQGITIDVAYRYFSTEKRKFIIADTPGHEQYTRNMATGASTASLAIILIDARYGVLTQTKRHSFIVSLLGIKHVVVAINKMDLAEYSEARFNEIVADYQAFSKDLDLPDVRFVPVSALKGENVVNNSELMPWYKGAPLMEILENVELSHDIPLEALRFPVQYVNRPNLNFRGYCGTVAAGTVRKGQQITALPSGKTSTVKSIVTFDGELEQAQAGQAVTITLNDEIDISRGDMLVETGKEATVSNTFTAHMVWMHEQPLQLGKQYSFKVGTDFTSGYVTEIDHQIDVNTLEHSPATELALNGIAQVKVELTEPVVFDAYRNSRFTGSFIVIDRLNNITVGAGMIDAAAEQGAQTAAGPISAFELELNGLIRKHFPHWEAKDLSALLK
ncbi:sulfate adenylyltransferase subunit 1 [Oceanospirillum multiglobuliferum]|uniref:Sulfate adenylyltransferase subunit 1 n=1 Tax=Oceanospirillum multiglobuliferum TaxID=64969 RepID=A0A1T4M9M3_9GAMM|nr:sulfate adenylyltransferase subunit CysN [Oceanospirillum multiglobuliferum]OPX56197.1 sulfate adenylyltransferase subunit CysN [Oceanospirillum multiglobuliferum]SJZ63546.1 sulfate adenylyltransferase subunit 1 [Oceanospirillum multiglobuliferum]